MRILLLPLLAATAVCCVAEQPTLNIEIPPNLSIPAQLKTTIKAEKAKAGDVVHFSTIEAVLVSKGVIMPANTKLYGRVLGAAPKQGEAPSYISVVVERAEWKQHSIPLHAFILSQVAASVPVEAAVDTSAPNPTDDSRVMRRRRRDTPQDDPRNTLASNRQADTVAWNNQVNMQAPFLKDVKMARKKNGITVLFSEKRNLKLEGGLRFMLQNVSVQAEVANPPATSESRN